MKKLSGIAIMAGLLVLSFASSAWASNIYFEVWGDGKWENPQNQEGHSKINYVVGGERNYHRFKIGGEYCSTTQKDGNNGAALDYRNYELKTGYALVKNDFIGLDVTMGYYNEAYDDDAATEIDGLVIGTDFLFVLDEISSVSGSVGYAANGAVQASGQNYNDSKAEILIFKLQGNYRYNEIVTGYCGMRYISSTFNNLKMTNYGITYIGLKFDVN